MRAARDSDIRIKVLSEGKPSSKPADEKREEREEADRQQLEEGLERFGGATRLKVYRTKTSTFAHAEKAYVTSYDVTDDLLANLEETLAADWGGGSYQIIGCLGAKNIRYINLKVDSIHPTKLSDDEQRKVALQNGTLAPPHQPPAAPLDERRIVDIIRETVRALLPPPKNDDQIMTLLREDRQRAHERELALLTGRNVTPTPTGPPTTAQQALTELVATSKLLDELKGDGGGEASPKRALGYAALEKLTDRIADKAGDRIGDAFGRVVEREVAGSTGAATASSPAPSTAAPATSSSSAAAPAAATPPQGQALTAEQLERVRNARGFRPAAPTVREAFPDKVAATQAAAAKAEGQ